MTECINNNFWLKYEASFERPGNGHKTCTISHGFKNNDRRRKKCIAYVNDNNTLNRYFVIDHVTALLATNMSDIPVAHLFHEASLAITIRVNLGVELVCQRWLGVRCSAGGVMMVVNIRTMRLRPGDVLN
jgi:hypothetical protein